MNIKKMMAFNCSLNSMLIFGGMGLLKGDWQFITIGTISLFIFCFLCFKYPDYFKRKNNLK